MVQIDLIKDFKGKSYSISHTSFFRKFVVSDMFDKFDKGLYDLNKSITHFITMDEMYDGLGSKWLHNSQLERLCEYVHSRVMEVHRGTA